VTATPLDPLLVGLVESKDEAARESATSSVIEERARPLIRAILRGRLSNCGDGIDRQELEDLESEAVVQLIARLDRITAQPISDFRSYVAVVAYNAWNGHLRRKFPNRWRLDSKVRYLLSHDSRFTQWTSEAGMSLASLAEFKERSVTTSDVTVPPTRPWSSKSFGDNMEEILRSAAAPLTVDDLISVIGTLTGVRDVTAVELTDEIGSGSSEIGPDAKLDRRTLLRNLWEEIRLLPPGQKHALLLGLRSENGEALLPFFPLLAVATLRDVARELDLEATDLAAIWESLPLDDLTIAARLGLTRQQVINLRKSGRERLGRRLRVLRSQAT